MTIPRRVLFISNGHGEDAIAAQIIRRLPPGITADAYPTLGSGKAYDGVAPLVGPRASLPSEGWRNVKGSVARDLKGGMLATLLPGIRFFRAARAAYDRVIVVGDMIGVYGCWLGGLRNILYLDVYKTGFGRGYLGIDKWILRGTAGAVYCRSDRLAQSLVAAKVDARHAGNIMMDTIPRTGLRLERRHPRAIAVLPGSRAHAVENFALQAKALAGIPDADIFVAVASGLDLPRHPGMTFVPGASLGDVLDTADAVLSQAGTATVQAIGLGKPVITFRAPQDRESRFNDESRLFGEARQTVPADPVAIAEKLRKLLADPAERARLGGIGKSRVGSAGAIQSIMAAI